MFNKDDVIRWAREAQSVYATETWTFALSANQLERFAALVAAAAVRETSAEYRMGWNDGQINEREACVAIAEKQRYALNICLTSYPSQNGTAVEIAAAIRARGQA